MDLGWKIGDEILKHTISRAHLENANCKFVVTHTQKNEIDRVYKIRKNVFSRKIKFYIEIEYDIRFKRARIKLYNLKCVSCLSCFLRFFVKSEKKVSKVEFRQNLENIKKQDFVFGNGRKSSRLWLVGFFVCKKKELRN